MKKYEKDETRIIDRAWNKSGLDIVDISGICIMTQTVFNRLDLTDNQKSDIANSIAYSDFSANGSIEEVISPEDLLEDFYSIPSFYNEEASLLIENLTNDWKKKNCSKQMQYISAINYIYHALNEFTVTPGMMYEKFLIDSSTYDLDSTVPIDKGVVLDSIFKGLNLTIEARFNIINILIRRLADKSEIDDETLMSTPTPERLIEMHYFSKNEFKLSFEDLSLAIKMFKQNWSERNLPLYNRYEEALQEIGQFSDIDFKRN